MVFICKHTDSEFCAMIVFYDKPRREGHFKQIQAGALEPTLEASRNTPPASISMKRVREQRTHLATITLQSCMVILEYGLRSIWSKCVMWAPQSIFSKTQSFFHHLICQRNKQRKQAFCFQVSLPFFSKSAPCGSHERCHFSFWSDRF